MIVPIELTRCPKCRRKWRKPARICQKCAAYGRIVIGHPKDRKFPCTHWVAAHGREIWLCQKCDSGADFFTQAGVRRLMDVCQSVSEAMNSTWDWYLNFAYHHNPEVAQERAERPLPTPIPIRGAGA